MKFKLIPILVLSLIMIPCVALSGTHEYQLPTPIYVYDFTNWNIENSTNVFENWDGMRKKWFIDETKDHKCIERDYTNDFTCITNNITGFIPTNTFVFSVEDLKNVSLIDNLIDSHTDKILDLVIQDSALKLCTTNLLCSFTDSNTEITQLYYNVVISNITFNVLSEKIIKNTSQDPVYAFNITNDIKLVNLEVKDFNTLTNLYPNENFRRANELFEFENPSSRYITNDLSVYVNGVDVGKVTNNNEIAWNDTLLEKSAEYIEITEISFSPFSSVTNAWDRNLDKGSVRQSISNFVANASNISKDFYAKVKEYFEANKTTLLPAVSITNICEQPVKVQIGDKVFDLNSSTTTNIVNQPLFALFDKKPINYWVTNSCSKCPITTNVVDQTFNKYNRDDYVIKLNKPLQKDVSYVSITNIPENAEVDFFNVDVKELSRTNGIIKIPTNSHTNGSFVVEQDYYAPSTNQFTSGCINSTKTIACPKLTPLDWQSCSITNTSKYPCNIKISYSNIINDVAIAIIDEVPIGANSMTKYKLKSDLIDPVTVIFSWNKNAITNTFTRVTDSENNSINIEVQGMDPVSAFMDNTSIRGINDFCKNVKNVKGNKLNTGNSTNLFNAFKTGIFKDYTNLADVTNIITQAKKPSGEFAFDQLLENGSIGTNYFKVITNVFYSAHPEQKGK